LPLLLLSSPASQATASAADCPDHPIRLFVPQAAGSATDNTQRILAAELSKELDQLVVVDDRPGGALTLGLDLVATTRRSTRRSNRKPSRRNSPKSATSRVAARRKISPLPSRPIPPNRARSSSAPASSSSKSKHNGRSTRASVSLLDEVG